jgi:hypothetical protein
VQQELAGAERVLLWPGPRLPALVLAGPPGAACRSGRCGDSACRLASPVRPASAFGWLCGGGRDSMHVGMECVQYPCSTAAKLASALLCPALLCSALLCPALLQASHSPRAGSLVIRREARPYETCCVDSSPVASIGHRAATKPARLYASRAGGGTEVHGTNRRDHTCESTSLAPHD